MHFSFILSIPYITLLPTLLQSYKEIITFLAFSFSLFTFFTIFAFVMSQKCHQVIISLASNEGQKSHLQAARNQLGRILSDIHYTPELWTEPVHSQRREPYLNQLCKATTTVSANRLEEALKEMEKRLGRTHNEDGIVAIDLDLLKYDDERYHHRDWERNYIKELIDKL